MNVHRRVVTISGLLMFALSVAGCGIGNNPEDYPDDDITLIVPAAAGGSADPVGREFASQLEDELEVSVTVENRDGGGTTVGTNDVLQSDPDGYTIGLFIDSALELTPQLQDLPYDASDADLIVGLADQPATFAVRDDAPWQSFEEFLTDARERPDEIQVGNSGEMTVTDLEIRKLADEADIDIQSVGFGGGGSEAFKALLGGQVDAVVGRAATFAGDVEAGNVRVLATFDDKAFKAVPDAVPTGDLDLDVGTPELQGILAPDDLPAEVASRLEEAAAKVARSSAFQEFLVDSSMRPRFLEGDELESTMDEYRGDYKDMLSLLEL